MRLISSISIIFFILFGQLAAEEVSQQFDKVLILDFANAGDHLIAVGDRGYILRTEKHPVWEKIETPLSATLTAVWFSDQQHGWAVGHDASILKTTDGGKHWRLVYQNEEAAGPLLDVWFSDHQQGIAIGAYGQYLLTHDGGETWKYGKFINYLNDVDNIQNKNSEELISVSDLHLNAIAQSETGKLYIVSEAGHIYRSDDSGLSWFTLPSPYAGSLFGILPLERDQLLVFGLRGHVFRSNDAGQVWVEVKSSTQELLMKALHIEPSGVVIAGMGGELLFSKDQGHSFTSYTLPSRRGLAAIIQDRDGSLVLGGENGISIFNLTSQSP